MNSIQPIATLVPYMALPGNHEVSVLTVRMRCQFNIPCHSSTTKLSGASEFQLQVNLLHGLTDNN